MEKNKKGNTLKNMMEHPAKIVKYYEFDETQIINCPVCGWEGKAKDGASECYNELYDISCPKCFEMLYVVSFPTVAETKEAARAGKQEALDSLPSVMWREEYFIVFDAVKLKSINQLPEIEGESLEFIFDIDYIDFKNADFRTVVRYKGKEIWREPGIYECWWRFNEIKNILKEKYGPRFKSLKPGEDAGYVLYGDCLSAPKRLECH